MMRAQRQPNPCLTFFLGRHKIQRNFHHSVHLFSFRYGRKIAPLYGRIQRGLHRANLQTLTAAQRISASDLRPLGRRRAPSGLAAVRMDAEIQQLKNHHRQCKAILQRFAARRQLSALQFRR